MAWDRWTYLHSVGCQPRSLPFDFADMGPEFLQIRLWTDVEEMEDRVQIPKTVHDRCTGQTPSVDRVEVERCLGSSSGLISDHVSFVQNDSVPEYLEERTCLISLDHVSHQRTLLQGVNEAKPTVIRLVRFVLLCFAFSFLLDQQCDNDIAESSRLTCLPCSAVRIP